MASTSVALPSDVYGVDVSFAGDDNYHQCETTTDTLLTVPQAGSKVTGGGWITPSTSSRTSFGLNLIPEAGNLFKGQFQVRANNGKSKFHGNTASDVVQLAANKVSWKGTGKWNGASGYTFEVVVQDNGSSGSKKGDTISVKIYPTGSPGSPVYNSVGPRSSREAT